MNTMAKKTDAEFPTISQRWGGLITVAAMLLLLCFFAYHQMANTGFFSATFGALEMSCLYGPILLSLIAPVARALNGRQNPARLFEIATNLFLAVGSLWLFIAFPFNFSHLADALPGGIRFVLSWITDDIGRAALILQVIVGPISAILTTWKYLSFSRHEPAIQS